MVRVLTIDTIPALLTIPLGLLLHLTTLLLTPLYNSLPLSLHPYSIYLFYALPPTAAYALLFFKMSGRDIISARASLVVMAISSDLVVVAGRRIGSIAGGLLGPEWGAFSAKVLLGIGAVVGGMGFALLCFVSRFLGKSS